MRIWSRRRQDVIITPESKPMETKANHQFIVSHGGGTGGPCDLCGQPVDSPIHDSPKRDFPSGTTSTKQPRLSLIPHKGLVNAAIRFELGLQLYGNKAWNGLTENQSALTDEQWLIERCSHAIEHLYGLIDFLSHKSKDVKAARGHAGAVAWCGLVLGEALGPDYDSYKTPTP